MVAWLVERGEAFRLFEKIRKTGQITSLQFFDRTDYPKNDICTAMEPYDDVFDDFQENSDYEELEEESVHELSKNACIICFNLQPDIVLLPCRHLHICNECNLKLQAESIANGSNAYLCPTCRRTVEDSMQVFSNI